MVEKLFWFLYHLRTVSSATSCRDFFGSFERFTDIANGANPVSAFVICVMLSSRQFLLQRRWQFSFKVLVAWASVARFSGSIQGLRDFGLDGD